MTATPEQVKVEALARALEHHRTDAAHGKDKVSADEVVASAKTFEAYLQS